jgi:hypothetical protein
MKGQHHNNSNVTAWDLITDAVEEGRSVALNWPPGQWRNLDEYPTAVIPRKVIEALDAPTQ